MEAQGILPQVTPLLRYMASDLEVLNSLLSFVCNNHDLFSIEVSG